MELKNIILMIVITCYSFIPLYADNTISIFNNKEGTYNGTLNGVLFVKTGDTEETENPLTVLEFQKGKAELSVEHDENEIYDSHFENYKGYTTSGKLALKYSTYSNANGLWITIGDDTYQVSSIDGACEYPVDGIKTVYQIHNNLEYLVISFSKEVLLNNYGPVWREKKSKGETYPPYQDAPKKYARIMPDSFLVFVINSTANPASNVVVGILEDNREVLANWQQGPSKDRVIRPLFEKKGTDWILSTHHPDKMKWIISFKGKNEGTIESNPKPAEYDTSLVRDLHTPELKPGQKLVIGEPTDDFSGWLMTKLNRPLVVVSKENFTDPDKWQAYKPDDNQIRYFKSVFRSEYPSVKNCDEQEILQQNFWEYEDDSIKIIDRAFRSTKDDMLISMRLEGCKCGMNFGPFLSQLFIFKSDKTFKHIEIKPRIPHDIDILSLFFIDAGDYDTDGQSEIVFFVSGYNEDGYALFYDSFRKSIVYTWSYH